MIYDKNQFTFNVIFVLILVTLIILNVYYATNFAGINSELNSINASLSLIEANQDFNFVQGSHHEVEYYLTAQGFLVVSVNDFGTFNGPSMQPAIFDSNTLLERKYDGSKLVPGQIIRFLREDGSPVVHRVRADYGDRVYVQGDSLKDGEIVRKNQITHVVLGILFT